MIYPKHLAIATEFVKKIPDHKFVIDHLDKPDFRQSNFTQWKNGTKQIAACTNVMCKVSGLVTQGDWNNWKVADFTYCLDVITQDFGINRLMFGSDWPVSLLAASYRASLNIVANYFSKFTSEEHDKFWGKNAIEFYRL